MTREEIYERLQQYLVELFEIPQGKISLDAHLVEDLDLDSIDAVDLILKLQELTGRKISPAQFQAVRTVRDVVEQVYELFGEEV